MESTESYAYHFSELCHHFWHCLPSLQLLEHKQAQSHIHRWSRVQTCAMHVQRHLCLYLVVKSLEWRHMVLRCQQLPCELHDSSQEELPSLHHTRRTKPPHTTWVNHHGNLGPTHLHMYIQVYTVKTTALHPDLLHRIFPSTTTFTFEREKELFSMDL